MASMFSSRVLAFATSRNYRDLTPGDRLAAAKLGELGATVVPAVWNDPDVKWDRFDAVIVRSTWDYHLTPADFSSWLLALERSGTPAFNPIKIMRWNMDKLYLRDLSASGVAIPRTVFLERGEPFDTSTLRASLGTGEVVIKPTISASARNTLRTTVESIAPHVVASVEKILAESGIMVQEYMPEIEREGEWSLIFFGREYSHAVRKLPSPGDFRVQEEHGGSYLPEIPPEELVRQAGLLLNSVGEEILYSRVDGVVRGGKLILMELELIEPELFFNVHSGSALRFAGRLKDLIGI